MKKHQAAFPWENPQIPADRPFVRRGEIGSHKDEMAAAVLDAFLREAATAMRQGGYLP